MLTQLRYPNLYAGPLVRLAALDSERDAAAMARWSGDTEYRRWLDNPVRHQSVAEAKEGIEQRAERLTDFPFAIHVAADDKFIGRLALWIRDWSSAEAFVGIGIGDRAFWSKGYGSAAMQLALRFAFNELNVERVSLQANAENARAIRAYEKCGFVQEGLERECEGRDGHRWDGVSMGLLRSEWQAGAGSRVTMLTQLRYPNLYAGPLVRLAALDPDRAAAAIARWSGDSEYRRWLDSDPVRHESAAQVKEELDKRAERPNGFPFAIHTAAEDKFIGFVGLWIRDWSSAEAFVGIGIGDRAYWSKGYGSAAMRLALRFAFHELNLERVALEANGDNARAIRAYEKCGFVHEGTQREWEGRDGRRADIINMGILRADWERAQAQP